MARQFVELKTMVAIFALVIGNASPVGSIPPFFLELIPSLISAGASLAGKTITALAERGYKVTMAIQVDNWCRYALFHPITRILGNGALSSVPSSILPATKEGFAARMQFMGIQGSFGTVSWEIRGRNRRLEIMWSVPFNFNIFKIWFGIGITAEGVVDEKPGRETFDQMYYGENDETLTFIRKRNHWNTDPIIFKEAGFEIEASMTNSHRGSMIVTVKPDQNHFHELAKSIKRVLVDESQKLSSLEADQLKKTLNA